MFAHTSLRMDFLDIQKHTRKKFKKKGLTPNFFVIYLWQYNTRGSTYGKSKEEEERTNELH